MVPYCSSSVPVAGQTTPLKTRPKTSAPMHRQPSLRYVDTSKHASPMAEEKALSSSYAQLQHHDRPQTSPPRGQDRPGMGSNERAGYRLMLQGGEIALTGYKVYDVKPSHPDSQLLSGMAKHRVKSSIGTRDVDSLGASSGHHKSVSLLRRLTQTLSSRAGLTSPLRDNLRERWFRISNDTGVHIDTPADTRLSSAMVSPTLENNREGYFFIETSRCSSGKAPRTEHSRATLLMKDAKDKQSGSSYVGDLGQKGSQPQTDSLKDLGELTHRSEASTPTRDPSSVNRRRLCSKRWQSASHRVLKCNRNDASVPKTSRKEAVGTARRETTSPRIITTNRMSTPTSENDTRPRPGDRAHSMGRGFPPPSLGPPGNHAVPGSQQDVTPSSSWNGPAGTNSCGATSKPTSPDLTSSSSKDLHGTFATSPQEPTEPENEGKPSGLDANTSQSRQARLISSDKRFVKTSPEHAKITASDLPITSPENLAVVSLSLSQQLPGQSVVCPGAETTDEEDRVSRPPEAADGRVQSVFLNFSKSETIRVPFSTAVDSESDSSSSARTVPLLSPQGVYGSGDFRAGPSSSQPPGGDVGGWDPRHTSDLHKLRELELHGNGCRTRSRNGSCRREKVPFNRCHEEIGALVPTITGCKPPTVRGNGIRKDLLGHTSHGVAGSEEDVAMGTLWSSSHHRQTRNTTITTSSSTSFISNKSLPISVGSGSSVALTSGSGSGTPLPAAAVAARRSVGGSTSNTFQSLSQQQTSPWAPSSFAMGNIVKSNKEADPKYSDPVLGAPPSFQQRLVELAALEAETVRWERSKKVKKKPLKQDKDS